MENFRNYYTVIVRIKNREYMYFKNIIYGYSPELEGLGFEHHEEAPTYREYSRPVEKSEIESAYRVLIRAENNRLEHYRQLCIRFPVALKPQ